MSDQRKTLNPCLQQQAAARMTQHVIRHPIFLQSHAIAAFCAHNGEMDPTLILQTALQATKLCYLPVLDNQLKNQLIFIKIDNHSRYAKNKYGILESIAMNSIDPVRFYAIEALELNTPAYMVTLQMAEYLRHLQQSEISSGLHERIISLLRYEQAQNPSGNV